MSDLGWKRDVKKLSTLIIHVLFDRRKIFVPSEHLFQKFESSSKRGQEKENSQTILVIVAWTLQYFNTNLIYHN